MFDSTDSSTIQIYINQTTVESSQLDQLSTYGYGGFIYAAGGNMIITIIDSYFDQV